MRHLVNYMIDIESTDGVERMDLDPKYHWETTEEYMQFIKLLEENPDSWVTLQTVGPEVSVPVRRIVQVVRLNK